MSRFTRSAAIITFSASAIASLPAMAKDFLVYPDDPLDTHKAVSGTPGRDVTSSFDRALLVPDHVGRPGAEFLYTREHEVYLTMCRR